MVEQSIHTQSENLPGEENTQLPPFNFENAVIWKHTFRGYHLYGTGREVKAELSIEKTQDEDIEFSTFIQYVDTDKHVIRGKNYSLQHLAFPFTTSNLRDYIKQRGILLDLPPEYEKLQVLKKATCTKLVSLNKVKNTAREREILRRENQELGAKINSMYYKVALEKAGIEWISSLNDELNYYIESDGRGNRYGGCPTLQNWLNMKDISKGSPEFSWIPGRLPGSYESGKRR